MKPHQVSADVAVGVHSCHHLLPWVTPFEETKRFFFQIAFRWNDLLIEIRAGFRQARFDSEEFARLEPTRLDAERGHPAAISCSQAETTASAGSKISRSCSPVSSVRRTSAKLAADGQRGCVQQGRVATSCRMRP